MVSYPLPLPDLRSLAEALDRGDTGLAVGGVVVEARAVVLAALVREGWPPGRGLIIVPHPSEAGELAAGLKLLAPDLRVGVVPAVGATPYLGSEPPLAARMEMVRLLDGVGRGEVELLVAPARALAAPVAPPQAITGRALTVSLGDTLDTRDLARRLTEAGYRRVDLVEEAGEFALRGLVVDLHAGGEAGLRVELDDDVVNRVQPFDPASQRSCGETQDWARVLPIDVFPVEASRLREVADELEQEYPAVAAQVRLGAERRLWWGALHLAAPVVTWLDLVDAAVVCDRDEVLGELGRWWAVQEREWRTLSARHLALPGPERLLVAPDGLRPRLQSAPLRVERLEVADGRTRWWRLVTHPMESFVRRIPDLVPTLRQRRAEDLVQVLVVASPGEERRLAHLLTEGGVVPVAPPPSPGQVALVRSELERGFIWEGAVAVYGRRDLTAAPMPRPRRSALASFVSDLRDLRPGDLVVHVDHGIGRFGGFRRVDVEGKTLEMLVLEYQRGDTLLVPVERADLIQKYAAGDGVAAPRLDRLGGGTWRRRTARVKRAVRELAAELLRLAAVRRAARGHAFSLDSPWQREFEAAFEYELTADQERAVEEIKGDMESARPMDRLLCGDVGYGKTEVALRAAFKAVLEGKQVVVLAPTTILVEQHVETFRRRLQGFPVETRTLSRFVPPQETRKVLTGLADGTVDIVVGTHSLLGPDVRLRDLGLVVVDEEQRFGVAQKERLKRLRAEVDVLAMSATPIPRTLNMAFSGLRDISLIETPPRDRQAVETAVLEFSEEAVREAVLYEIERGGQVFFVHNRVRSIGAFGDWLRRVVPEAVVVVAHGQMPERALARAMRTFLAGEADVLLATAIIENGLDIANANTLLVSRAERFGLAQLYQLRGRVGRSERLAFAYFLVPPGQPLSPPARARLAAVQEFCELGAGFRIAARDLEIRGAGNLLGAEQHGFLEAVGFETYCQLLEEAVAELEGRPLPVRREMELRLGLDLQLPETYIPEASLRLSFYKRLASCVDEASMHSLLEEVGDRYGPAPAQLEALAQAQRVRLAATRCHVISVARHAQGWSLRLDPDRPPPAEIVTALAGLPAARVTASGEVRLPGDDEGEVVRLLSLLEAMAGSGDRGEPVPEPEPW